MTVFKKIVNFYINTSVHVALSVYCLVRITELYVGLLYNESLNYFIFYGTITAYNFVKYASIAQLHHRSLTNNLKTIQIFSLGCFLLMLFYGYQLSIKTALIFIPFGLLTVLYAVPFFGITTKNLRRVPSLKILIIGLVWSGVTVILPLVDAKLPMNLEAILLYVQRFLFVIVLTLPFDIRDMNFDNKKLQTIPQLLGVERTKKIGYILLLCTVLIEFFITPNSHFKSAYGFVFFVLLIFLQRASRKQSNYYSSFWVEAIPIFWWIVLLIFTNKTV